MKRVVFLLCLLFGLLVSFQVRANPANCDGDMTPDQTEFLEYVVGLHPILFGGPVAILRTCERVKKFLTTLSNMGISKRTQSVSSDQVRSALEESAAATPEVPTAPVKTPLTLARAKIKKDEVLLKDRELAANLVPVCKSIMSEQACVGRLQEIERLRDDVARMNQDPELMAFIPPITLDSPDLIAQTGWERVAGGGSWTNRAGNKADREICPELTRLINGLVANAPERARERLPEFRSNCADRDPSYAAWLTRWETQLAGVSTKAGTKGGAYVRPEDCERMSRQIDADLQARPKEEPASLSFFEVECAGDASGKYAGQVASWKQAIATRKGAEALNQWDGGIRQAEAEQRKAKEEEERRVAAQKSAEDERQRVAVQGATKPAAGPSANPSARSYSSVCIRNYEKVDRETNKYQSYPYNKLFFLKVLRIKAQLLAPCPSESIKGIQSMLESQERWCAKNACSEWGGPEHAALNKAWFQVFERETQAALSNPGGYSADLEAGESPRQPASAGADSAACEAAVQKAERENAAAGARPPQGALAALQQVMWMTRNSKAAIDANCSNNGKYAAMRQKLQQAYNSAATNCRQLKSGGGECTPERN